MTTTAQKLAADLEAGWACDTSPDEMTAAAAELRRLDDLCAEQKADADKIKAAITRAGLTLVKTASGYEVRNFGRIEAQAEAKPAPAEPVGWKLVPVEPTPEMIEAANEGDDAYTLRCFGPGVQRVMQGPEDHWLAMLAAAPAAPAEVSGHAEFALQALVAAGHISQATVDGALQIAKRVVPAPAAPAPHPDTKDAERLDWLVNGDGDGPSLILWDQDYKGQPFTTLRACGSINVTGRFDNVRDAIDAAMRGEQGENQP